MNYVDPVEQIIRGVLKEIPDATTQGFLEVLAIQGIAAPTWYDLRRELVQDSVRSHCSWY